MIAISPESVIFKHQGSELFAIQQFEPGSLGFRLHSFACGFCEEFFPQVKSRDTDITVLFLQLFVPKTECKGRDILILEACQFPSRQFTLLPSASARGLEPLPRIS